MGTFMFLLHDTNLLYFLIGTWFGVFPKHFFTFICLGGDKLLDLLLSKIEKSSDHCKIWTRSGRYGPVSSSHLPGAP